MAADLLPYKVLVAVEVVGAMAVATDGCECEVKFDCFLLPLASRPLTHG